ncbi:MAG: hypothetical protein P4M15_11600 [Alphaproteobacteria bacterium]|nr:hypothetical protein [Alphaproteobacteria bacterium]
MSFTHLLQGIDTLEVSYYLAAPSGEGLNFVALAADKEALRLKKRRQNKVISLGCEEFLLSCHGTNTGFSFFMENDAFEVSFGEFVQPNFFVKFKCEALWHGGFQNLHNRFLAWARSVGLNPYKPEVISRVDIAFDYLLPCVDFDLESFVSQAEKDNQRRKNRKTQTFSFGSGDKMLRVYNKSDEIKEKSVDKIWFYSLWDGIVDDVWRIEWQARRDYLKTVGLHTVKDLTDIQGNLLRGLATEHTRLCLPSEDSNKSRWPLHPLWQDYLERVSLMPSSDEVRTYNPNIVFDERLHRYYLSMYGYLKRIAAIQCLKQDAADISLETAMRYLRSGVARFHSSLDWQDEVAWRVDEMRFNHE